MSRPVGAMAHRMRQYRQARWVPASSVVWAVAVVVTLIAAGLIPLIADSRYYFHGDTQSAYLGWWYHLGEQVRAGNWPLLDVQSWRAGNLVAEGQWGLFSPLTITIGVGATLVSDLVLFVTVVKIALLAFAGVGVFLLTRSYGVPPAAAYVAGVAASLGGGSQYMEWPSWVNGQMITALLPWAWWAMRRTMRQGSNPWPVLLTSYLIVTVGYVYGTLYLAVVFLACLVEAWVSRDRAAAMKVVFVGVCTGLVAIAVYLPGLLTSPVTIRDQWDVVSDSWFQVELSGLVASLLPSVLTPTGSPVGDHLPMQYIAWFLPLLAWVDPSRVRRELSGAAGLVSVVVLLSVWVLGPNRVGPIRWHGRVMPILVLATVVLAVVIFTKTVQRRPSARRLLLSLGWTLGAAYLVTARSWQFRNVHLVSMLLVMLGIVVVWALIREGQRVSTRKSLLRGMAAAFVGCWCLALMLVQHHYFPQPYAKDRNMPAAAADYRVQLPEAGGDAMLVGDPDAAAVRDPSVSEDLLIAASWYLNPKPVQSTYTTISFRAFSARFCVGYNGSTCPRAIQELLEREPTTGERWIDLLSVSTLVIFRDSFPADAVASPPPGWREVESTEWIVTWVRDVPRPTAGGVVWSSPGVEVTETHMDDRTLRFRVGEVPDGGGTVVLSRLAWPGYRVDGARLAGPVADQLVTVRVDAESSGQEVRVRYSPPGWMFELFCWFAAVGLGLLWTVFHALVRWREKRSRLSAGS